MQTEKYCGICGQKLNIEFEYRKTAKTTCPRCESESEWKFYKNGNFTELIHVNLEDCGQIRSWLKSKIDPKENGDWVWDERVREEKRRKEMVDYCNDND